MSDLHFSHEVWLAKLKDHLETEQYAATTASKRLAIARHFLTGLEKQQVDVGAARPAHVEEYLEQARRRYRRCHGHSPDYKSWRVNQNSGIHMLLRLVQGQWPPVSEAVTPAEVLQREICGEYTRTGLCGLSQETISSRCAEAGRFLVWLGERATREGLATLTLVDVDAYMKDRAGSLCRRSLPTLATDLRSLLRWLHRTGRTTRDLSSAVIRPSLYAFEGIPSVLRAEDMKKVLEVVRQDGTPKGIRDYAILILLAKFGVRAGEITALRLEDVDWRGEVIRVRHRKTGVTSSLPMLREVGEAILDYLQKSRPKTPLREIFIRCRAPYRPFQCGGSLYSMVQRRLAAAGVIATGKYGPHAFRHARAVSLLRATIPVKEIGDLLGHRAADSTLVYLKLATADLRGVALEIPTEVKA